ncbi:hypothetical protein KPG66_09245 [Mycetohabitans sp. B2]|uniref:hypothetical protein n=1 Tax=Mycetohabitans sp. B2 TaxID=2841274 RepID=UPI001F3CF7D1|nr:hypothetical protein [Mycetohabitans sp. B2]MCF7696271.1 hypothetical protein [Mycetohabitans sp. B2]
MLAAKLGKAAVKVGGGLAVGAMIDRLSKTNENSSEAQKVQAPGPSRVPNSLLRTGNQRLNDISQRIAPSENANPVTEGIVNQYNKRVNLLKKFGTVITQPDQTRQNVQTALHDLADDARTLQGAANIARGNASITPQEATKITHAVATDSVEGTYKTVKAAASAAIASVTTTPEGVQQVADAMSSRISHDTTAAAAGLGAANAAAAAIGMIPHPAAKVASAVLKIGGTAATGAQLSEKMREASGKTSDSATGKVLGEVLREKATNKAHSNAAPVPSTSLNTATQPTSMDSHRAALCHAIQAQSTTRPKLPASVTQSVEKWMTENWAPAETQTSDKNQSLQVILEDPLAEASSDDEETTETLQATHQHSVAMEPGI